MTQEISIGTLEAKAAGRAEKRGPGLVRLVVGVKAVGVRADGRGPKGS